MTGRSDRGPMTVVAASHGEVTRARATVRSLLATAPSPCLVVDVDGDYRRVADEDVLTVRDVADRLGLADETAAAAATLHPGDFVFLAAVLGAEWALGEGAGGAVVLGAGTHVVGATSVLLRASTAAVTPATDATGAVRRGTRSTSPGAEARGGNGPLLSRALYAVRSREHAVLLRGLAADWRTAARALELFTVTVGARLEPGRLITPWRRIGAVEAAPEGRLLADGTPVCAVDLTALDAARPWLLEAEPPAPPIVLLSEHPALARLVLAEAEARRADDEPPVEEAAPPRLRLDDVLRAEARRSVQDGEPLPDLLQTGSGPDLEAWALELVPAGHPRPLARYLGAVRTARPHLRRSYPGVPGPDVAELAQWALKPGPGTSVDLPGLLADAARLTLAAQPPEAGPRGVLPEGVNLVGYLAGELGLGESARLVDQALHAVGVATSTHDVSRRLQSRRTASYRVTDQAVFDTTLVCVNGAETAAIAPQVRDLLERTVVIGMWYWELEDFPPSQQAGFEHVDEIWAATDFMRDAIARHAGDIPVRTVTPPLPQALADPGEVPARFGIPDDRPWFLFTFDFLSSAERKNPFGLVDAFTSAFADLPVEQRPSLVIKSINADRRPADAERLRLQVAGRPDVVFLDAYLDNHERHVLVSHCTAFVSLHRAEGLGLTVAEAMGWGKPVITTAYGGVTQFCDEDNSFLVGWERGRVQETYGPYLAGMPWAEPDLEQAARYLRLVVDDPQRAAAVGARAAEDIRVRHNPGVAGEQMLRALAEARAAHLPSPPGDEESPVPESSGPTRRRSRLRRLLG